MIDHLIIEGLAPGDECYDVWIFDVVRVVEAGEDFGEIVLLEPKQRTVTAVCLDSETELLGLSNDAYNRVIEKAVKRDITKRVQFL